MKGCPSTKLDSIPLKSSLDTPMRTHEILVLAVMSDSRVLRILAPGSLR